MRDTFSPDRRGPLPWRVLLFLLLMLPFTLSAQTGDQAAGIQVPNPGADLWRAVRQREGSVDSTQTQVRGVETAVLINPQGNRWRQFRMQQLIPNAGYLLTAVLGLVILFFLLRGQIKVAAGMSDKKLFRYSGYERTLHWFMATLFILLALTGMVLMFGRSILLPVMGPEIFSSLAAAGKLIHTWLGPLFALTLVLLLFKFVRRNIYAPGDLTWLLKGGGVIGKTHAPSGFFNMGEKSLFWLVILVGSLIAVSGIILLFPSLGLGRSDMTLSHLAHAISATILLAAIIGHIYIGSIGMEGALEGMKTGYCDLNWAKAHHDRWASEVEDQAVPKE